MNKSLPLAALVLALVSWGCQQTSSSTAQAPAAAPASEQMAKVDVTEAGFVPSELTVQAGQPLKLTFTRTTDKTCATSVIFGDEKITKELPLNTPVTIDVTPKQSEVKFTCGMNMFSGKLVVK